MSFEFYLPVLPRPVPDLDTVLAAANVPGAVWARTWEHEGRPGGIAFVPGASARGVALEIPAAGAPHVRLGSFSSATDVGLACALACAAVGPEAAVSADDGASLPAGKLAETYDAAWTEAWASDTLETVRAYVFGDSGGVVRLPGPRRTFHLGKLTWARLGLDRSEAGKRLLAAMLALQEVDLAAWPLTRVVRPAAGTVRIAVLDPTKSAFVADCDVVGTAASLAKKPASFGFPSTSSENTVWLDERHFRWSPMSKAAFDRSFGKGMMLTARPPFVEVPAETEDTMPALVDMVVSKRP